ncbi:MAG: hypothetical protein ACFFCS_22155 [Candidatus Hodarchaeota archaeon]
MTQDGKLKVDIYVPLKVCACEWSNFMDAVFTVLLPYMKKIDFETKDIESEEAKQLNLQGKRVVVEGKHVFSSSSSLKVALPKILAERGLLD